jgi:hypothetical protein
MGLVAALACVFAGCGGGSHPNGKLSSPTASTRFTGAAVPVASTTQQTAGRGSARVSSGGNSSSGALASQPGPAVTGAQSPDAGQSPGSEPTGTPVPAAAGTYTYRQGGSSTFGSTTQPVPSQGTMVVDPATGGGSAQTWHRYEDTRQPPTDTDLSFTNGGVFIATEVVPVSFGGQSTTITCSFPKPGVPAPPWPPAVGKSFGVTGSCGSFSATVSGRITGQTTDDAGGHQVPVYVLDSTLVTRGQIQLTATETDWLAVGFRLPLHTQTQSHGTYGIASFSSNTTADLEWMTPK